MELRDLLRLADDLWDDLLRSVPREEQPVTLVGIGRGGVAAALALASMRPVGRGLVYVRAEGDTWPGPPPIWYAYDRLPRDARLPALALVADEDTVSSLPSGRLIVGRSVMSTDVVEFPW